MVELLIAIGGLVGGFLIGLGVHKGEHKMIKEKLESLSHKMERHDERIDGHDVMFASMQPTLEYLVKAVDRNYEAIESHKNEEAR